MLNFRILSEITYIQYTPLIAFSACGGPSVWIYNFGWNPIKIRSYNGTVDASSIPPEWHSWLHKIIKTTPDQVKFNNFNWQKEHKKNLTGTNQAYIPQHEKKLPYKRWQPK